MPLYTFQCPNCGAQREEMRTVEERGKGERCYRSCQATMRLVVTPVAGYVKDPAAPKSRKRK
jgi:putative FmdB family regulatory protein